MQDLAGRSDHSEHILLRSVRRHSESIKMKVRHVHARIHRARFRRLGREIVYIGDSERVTGESANDRSNRLTLEREGIPSIFGHSIKREGYNVALRPYLGRLRHRYGLSQGETREQHLDTKEQDPGAISLITIFLISHEHFIVCSCTVAVETLFLLFSSSG